MIRSVKGEIRSVYSTGRPAIAHEAKRSRMDLTMLLIETGGGELQSRIALIMKRSPTPAGSPFPQPGAECFAHGAPSPPVTRFSTGRAGRPPSSLTRSSSNGFTKRMFATGRRGSPLPPLTASTEQGQYAIFFDACNVFHCADLSLPTGAPYVRFDHRPRSGSARIAQVATGIHSKAFYSISGFVLIAWRHTSCWEDTAIREIECRVVRASPPTSPRDRGQPIGSFWLDVGDHWS